MMVAPSSAAGATVWLYNDTFAPELPEPIPDSNRYVMLASASWGVEYFLYYSDIPFVAVDSNGAIKFAVDGASSIAYSCYKNSDSSMYWDDRNVIFPHTITTSDSYVLWTNYDLYYASGGLALEGSDPVPFGDFPGGDSGGSGGTGDSGSTGSSCSCPNYSSILSLILSHLTEQSDWLAVFGQAWITSTTRILDALENLSPVADPNETELKEATSDAMESVNDSLFADDAPTKVTASDVKDVAQIGAAASSMFDSGVSVGSFFDTLNDLRFIAFFSQATYDDLNTVPSVSTYSRGEQNGYVDYYSENLNKIQQFAGGG